MKCDTIYGILGIGSRTENRVRKIKGRTGEKPFLYLIPDASWLPRFTSLPLPQALEGYWPGPLTMIFPSKWGGTTALRVPQDAFLRKLTRELGDPILSTSVNREGKPPLSRIKSIIRSFEKAVDLIVDSGDQANAVPSTILDLTREPYRIVRKGAVDLSTLYPE